MDLDSVIYIIEADPMLSAVKQHIADKKRVADEVRALAQSFGAERVWTDRTDGVLRSVSFKHGEHHPDFTKPDRKNDNCRPKQKTEAAAKFAAQVGYPSPVDTISKAFNIPLSLSYKHKESNGWSAIGSMLSECGFLYFGVDGPYALWIPDVAGEIAAWAAQGRVANEKFDMVLPGCRRILTEEWDLMVAQHALAEKKAAAK